MPPPSASTALARLQPSAPAPSASNPSAAKRRREALGQAVAAGSSGSAAASERSQLADATIEWFERLFEQHDRRKAVPLRELWFCEADVEEWLPEAFCPSQLQCLKLGMSKITEDAKRDRRAVHAATRPERRPRRGPHAGAGKSTHDRCPSVALRRTTEGWETAAAYDVLRTLGLTDRKVDAVEWYERFKDHGVARRAKLKDEELLAHFIVGLNNLQVLGFATASKRTRGALEKMVYG